MGNQWRAGGTRHRLTYVLLALLLCVACLPTKAASRVETIRVAFVDQGGLSDVDENGTRSGYEYEYLQEIAQYTGWDYSFVNIQKSNTALLDAMEQLEKGEIDLMTSTIYSEALAEKYDYSAYSHGSVNTVLAVIDDSSNINEANLLQHRSLRVAVHKKALARVDELQQFCTMSGVEAELVYCNSLEEQREVVRSGGADVLLEVDVNLPDDLRAVARFAPRPYYFVTTKGNAALVNKLNAALLNIEEADPYFATGLYIKYFNMQHGKLYLTEEERAYIRGAGVIRVAVMAGRMPIQDIDPVTGEFTGMSRQVFDHISQSTGLQFEFVPLSASETMADSINEGTVELTAGMPYNYVVAERLNVAMSRPYFSAQTTYALARGVSMDDLEGKRAARSMSHIFYEESSADSLQLDTPKECLDALEWGEADYAVTDSYTMQYSANMSKYRNITLVPQSGVTMRQCIGVSKPVNVALLTILNKVIHSLSESELQTMIYRNATAPIKVTLSSFLEDNFMLVLVGVTGLAGLVIGLLVIYFRAHLRLSRREALESERYKLMGELTGEHIFEYDFRRDRLTFSEQSAKVLNMESVRENYLFRLQQDRSIAAETARAFYNKVIQERSGMEELSISMGNGIYRWFRVALKVIGDKQGKPLLAVGRLTDIQREREELEQLAEKARRDSLTGVYNGETTRQIALRRMEDCAGNGGALLVIDVDEFKDVNDKHGHFMGDQALKAVAQLLEDTFRRSDVVGRLGGDEFIIFMDRVTDRSVVESKCQELLQGIKNFPFPVREIGVTISIGGAMVAAEEDYDRLYQLADRALYEVKGLGRNGYKVL